MLAHAALSLPVYAAMVDLPEYTNDEVRVGKEKEGITGAYKPNSLRWYVHHLFEANTL